MTYFKRAALCGLLCGMISCNFEPTDGVVTPIKPPSLAGLSINLNEVTEDTIRLAQITKFSYNFQAAGKTVVDSKVYMNQQLLPQSSEAGYRTFELDPEDWKTGTYKLHVEFTARPGTGSLGDKLGAEVISVWTERIVVVDHTLPASGSIAITSVENVDNTILVRWNAYTSVNFHGYILKRLDFDSRGQVVGGDHYEIADAHQVEQVDRTYVGGKSVYTLQVRADNSLYTAPLFTYQHPYKPDLHYVIHDDGTVTVKWNSLSAIRRNFNRYELRVNETNGPYSSEIFTRSVVTDTTVTFTPKNFLFGDVKNLLFKVYTAEYANGSNVTARLHVGQPFKLFHSVFQPRFDPASGGYYLLDPYSVLHRVNAEGISIDSLDRSYSTISINDHMGIASRPSPNNSNEWLVFFIDLATMSEARQINVPSVGITGISDNDLFSAYNMNNLDVKIYNLDGVELASIPYRPISEPYRGISKTGLYAIADGMTYRFNGTTYVSWTGWPLNFNHRSTSFFPDQPTKAIVANNLSVRKFDMETGKTDVSSNNYHGPCSLDPVTGKLGCMTDNAFVILDPNTLALEKSLPVSTQNSLFFLTNGTILCTSGMQIKLSDIP